MKILVEKLSENPATLLRRAGYIFQRKDGGEMSFVRPIANGPYPRFHLYAKTEGLTLSLNLHLDQKKETYGKATRHHGEYENEGVVGKEGRRIATLLGENTKIVG